ncbi:MAG: 4Fe-4S binding protein [Cyclobacteriaceae bacterium]|nr:4Fe-4S binding protein [Cyclobacteriaceae bacterium]MCK5206904.1 4Fe-4S binding protein [Cyclobacteriaceae bacterium]MCK5278649.1 4Fe-4S binding protein [Cyclobacteriaceae bacterium]
MSNQVYLKNTSTLAYDDSKCTGCGICAIVCPHRVLLLKHRKIKIVDFDRCMECGACMVNCQDNAITVNQGVGCAAAVINGFFNKTEPSCGCNTSCG